MSHQKEKEDYGELLAKLDDKIKRNSKLLEQTSAAANKPSKKKRPNQGRFAKFPPPVMDEDERKCGRELMKLQKGYRKYRQQVGIKRRHTHTKVPQIPQIPKGWKRKRKISPIPVKQEPPKRRSVTPPPQQRAMAPPSPIFNLDIAPREVSRPPRERSESPPPPPADDYAASGSAEDISGPFSPSSDYGPEELHLQALKLLSDEPPQRDPHERNRSWNPGPKKGAHERYWSLRSNRAARLPRNTSTLSRMTVDFDSAGALLPRETSIMSQMSKQTEQFDRDLTIAMTQQNFEDSDEDGDLDLELIGSPEVPSSPRKPTDTLPAARAERQRQSWLVEWRSDFVQQLAKESQKVEEDNRRLGVDVADDMNDQEFQLHANRYHSPRKRNVKSGELSMAEIKFEEYRLNSMFNEIRTMSQTPNASMDFDSIPLSVGEKRRKVEQIRHNYSRELDAELNLEGVVTQDKFADSTRPKLRDIDAVGSVHSIDLEGVILEEEFSDVRSDASFRSGAESESGGSTLPSLKAFRRKTPHLPVSTTTPLDKNLPVTIRNRLPGKKEKKGNRRNRNQGVILRVPSKSNGLSSNIHSSPSPLSPNTAMEPKPTKRLPDAPSFGNPGNQEKLRAAMNSESTMSLRDLHAPKSSKKGRIGETRTQSSPALSINPNAQQLEMPKFPPLPPVTPDFNTNLSNTPQYHQYVNQANPDPGETRGGRSGSKRQPRSYEDTVLLGGDPVE